MHQAGFTPEDYAQDDVEVWPDNWLAWRLFSDLSTQWIYVGAGMGPPKRVGLVYASLYPLLDRACTTQDQWQQTFHDIQACEDAALEQMRKNP